MPFKTRSKYNVDTSNAGKLKRTYKDICFDSEMEMRAYRDWLEPLLITGEIIQIDRQVKYILQDSFVSNDKKFNVIYYKSDFDITYANGDFKVIDIKGMLKNEDKLKEKLFRYRYPNIDFEFIGDSKIDGGFVPLEIILKARKERKKNKIKK